MSSQLWALAFATTCWWSATALLLYVVRLPRATFPASIAMASALLMAALIGVRAVGPVATAGGAYCGFACGLAAWGWVELSFLTGFLTGPRRRACAAPCGGVRHFGHAIEAILYHELAIIAVAALLAAASWRAPNRYALATFAVLWIMRSSAKLNLFFGVRNPGEGLLPAHLRYLQGFFHRAPMNLLFPLSVTGGTLATAHYALRALQPGAGEFVANGDLLLAGLLGLAVLEHWLLVLPLPVEAMWSVSLRAATKQGPASGAAPPAGDSAAALSHGVSA